MWRAEIKNHAFERFGEEFHPLLDANNFLGSLRRADEHILVHDVEIIVCGVILIVWEAVDGDTRHIDARSIDDALIVGRGGCKFT